MPIHILKHLPELTTPSDAWPAATPGGSGANVEQGEERDIVPDEETERAPIVRHIQNSVSLVFDPKLPNLATPGKGDLYVAESQLIWHDPANSTTVCIDYPSIVIHAISRQGDVVVNAPCIYCQLAGTGVVDEDGVGVGTLGGSAADHNGNGIGADHEGEEDREEEPTCEFRLVPDDVSSSSPIEVDAIFQALSDCAALHPDADGEEEEDECDEWYTADHMNVSELNEYHTAVLDHLESVFEGPAPGREQHSHNVADRRLNGNPTNGGGQGQFADADEQMER
ncbi:hypothetical protein HK104_008199 [Borealophlyctis nickersoniae]|nr:hypothetical protein HK104_008199 [Borealophlyctis nickersoniae]